MAGGMDTPMTMERFVAAVGQEWRLDTEHAHALFRAGDVDNSGRLNRHEYLLVRDAFRHPPSRFSAHDELRNLRARAIFYRFSRGCETLDRAALGKWVRALCAGEHHTSRIFEQLLGDTQARRTEPKEGLLAPSVSYTHLTLPTKRIV